MTRQKLLFRTGDFDGETYEPPKDERRMSRQLKLVFDVVEFGSWRSLEDIKAVVSNMTGENISTPSISARLRDLRKEKFGGYTVERKRVKGGLFVYRVVK